jgi:hypothetical protein
MSKRKLPRDLTDEVPGLTGLEHYQLEELQNLIELAMIDCTNSARQVEAIKNGCNSIGAQANTPKDVDKYRAKRKRHRDLADQLKALNVRIMLMHRRAGQLRRTTNTRTDTEWRTSRYRLFVLAPQAMLEPAKFREI